MTRLTSGGCSAGVASADVPGAAPLTGFEEWIPMKRETLRHPKTLDLAARLEVDRPAALGYLTLLWDFVAEFAIQGDVGKWQNGVIAGACDWRGDHDSFVNALVESRWLDVNTTHRLIVHDWPHHCEQWVKLKLSRLKLLFLDCYGIAEPITEGTAIGSAEGSASRDRTEPNQSKPLIPAGRLGGRDSIAEKTVLVVSDATWVPASPLMQRIHKTLEPNRPQLKPKDRELCCKAAIIAQQFATEAWLTDVLKDIDDRSTPPDTPWGYLKGALAKSATRAGWNFYEAMKLVNIPDKYLNPPKA